MFPLRDTQRSRSFPILTILLIAVNFSLFLFELSLGPYLRDRFLAAYGLVPYRASLFTMFTSMFLHGGWMHVLGNVWFLWVFGDNVEDALGHSRYLLFYLTCGMAAAFTQVFFQPLSRVPTIGASGAIAGVMGAYLVTFPRSRILTLVFIFFFATTLEVPAVFMLLYWFLIQFFEGVGSIGYSSASAGGVAWFAHIGGFLSGIVLVYFLKPSRRRW
ncbi:MAG TPA: rhomboid family intramembrane serine protease [Bryobacteraceae bacterium]|jgi:membrane associated rhomboid family serine protease|nr:rhomboid family intramembrane serine protease [Bryobacteraceae bacterium]